MGLFDIFRRRKEEVGIGIDIGSTAIKVAVTTKEKGGEYKIRDIIHHPIPSGIVDKGNILDPNRLLKEIREIKGRIPQGFSSYAFSPYKTTLFSFKLIKEVRVEDIEKAVYKEVSHRIPVPISELSIDYDYSSLEDGSRTVTVIVGKKKHIEDMVNLLEEAGVKVDSITSTYAAIANTALVSFPDVFQAGCGMVVDIGYSMCCCVCINRSIATHGGCIESGVGIIEEEVAAATSSTEEETRLKVIKEEVKPEILDAAAFRFMDRVLGEVDAYSTLCQSETPVPCNNFCLVLSGGGSAIADMGNRFRMQLASYEVHLLDPLAHFTVSPEVMEKMERLGSPRFTVAIGASLL